MVLMQCLYGGTPFVDEDRTKTKLKILVCLEILKFAIQQLILSRDTKRNFISLPQRNCLENIGYHMRPGIL